MGLEKRWTKTRRSMRLCEALSHCMGIIFCWIPRHTEQPNLGCRGKVIPTL